MSDPFVRMYVDAHIQTVRHGLRAAWVTVLHETARNWVRVRGMQQYDPHWKRVSRQIRAQFEARAQPQRPLP